MKKILSVLLAALLIFSMVGCASTPDPTSDPTATPTEGFTAPEDYVAVMVVTINPQFRLYLDAYGVVLAAEPLNDDAKAMEDKLEVVNKSVETAVKELVTKAKDEGYVKENATVSLTLTETTVENVNTQALLDTASNAVMEVSTILEVTLDVQTEDISASEETTEPPTKEPTEAPTEEPTEAPCQHTYKDATCTEPKTCTACGATEGAAKGHSYKDATCTAAKTCKTCGATDGKAKGHDYKEGVCSRCKAKDPNFSYTPVSEMLRDWGAQFAIDGVHYGADMAINKNDTSCSAGISMQVSVVPDDAQEGEYFEFEGKFYHAVAAGDGDDLGEVIEEGNTVTVYDCEGQKLVLERTGEKTLKVVSCEDGFAIFGKIPTGTVFTYIS